MTPPFPPPFPPDGALWAVVPAKSLARAKSRLVPALGDVGRRQLAASMLAHVLQVLRGAPEIAGLAVITDCPLIAAQARPLDALVLHDPPGNAAAGTPPDLGCIVDGALHAVAERGATHAIVVMGDLPWLSHDDLRATISTMEQGCIALAPDRAAQGTNALGLSLLDRPHTCFGHADSLARHVRRFEDQGRPYALVTRPGLAFDVDTPDDLAQLDAKPSVTR